MAGPLPFSDSLLNGGHVILKRVDYGGFGRGLIHLSCRRHVLVLLDCLIVFVCLSVCLGVGWLVVLVIWIVCLIICLPA